MSLQTAEETIMATHLVEVLNLEGVDPSSIAPEDNLFGHNNGGLGLDSIDALEIALMVQTQYGVELQSNDPNVKHIFTNLRNLTVHVLSKKAAVSG